MPLQSQLFKGHSEKRREDISVFECPNCGSRYKEVIGSSCRECDAHLPLDRCQATVSVDVAKCASCGDDVRYIRDDAIATQWDIPGYICSDCENITELEHQGQMHQPIDFLQNDHGRQFYATPVDGESLEKVARLFSLQTKVDGIGFWSYDANNHRVWLASQNGVYCGFATLNEDDVLIQIWVDEGMRRQGVAAQLLEYICENVLPSNGELHINQPLDDGWDFFRSLADDEDRIFGREVMMNF
ncbi:MULTISPECIES: GNAT family N-acetyltransferase [Halorussus]|uniref:GNAT family N-acetyltransferase n=1 Tax=Halorussus TaxID=1070314 RepID=UPI00209CE9A8|nr:GNAT family N-acetyltransferase [Halorussus vallis]USZ77204.1 GNAT family N-acetyltransferase [Halorussus vallis]